MIKHEMLSGLYASCQLFCKAKRAFTIFDSKVLQQKVKTLLIISFLGRVLVRFCFSSYTTHSLIPWWSELSTLMADNTHLYLHKCWLWWKWQWLLFIYECVYFLRYCFFSKGTFISKTRSDFKLAGRYENGKVC